MRRTALKNNSNSILWELFCKRFDLPREKHILRNFTEINWKQNEITDLYIFFGCFADNSQSSVFVLVSSFILGKLDSSFNRLQLPVSLIILLVLCFLAFFLRCFMLCQIFIKYLKICAAENPDFQPIYPPFSIY